ncbi:T9SS type A sorting domain-containing protein [Hymenobacter aquaticus]|uniref:T9SS type A sorting domain-containing protein n=1 Tax=Hymenobacter aquaticus TaxID=1867101 RepID=A0A4Z0Q5Y3_9BACT|nr:T9SS type A sorting domain-containing protein [Hymenobacter aquaticus]TGE25085.1 T9SS type A sorting domain-containing protein [Hymenobacter aquaticus]
MSHSLPAALVPTRVLTTLLLLVLPGVASAQAPAFEQALPVGVAAAGSNITQTAIATDAQGNTVVAGQFSGSIRFGTTTLTGTADAFVAKRDANGTWLWATQASGPDSDYCADMLLDAQGQLYVVGSFSDGQRTLPSTATFGSTVLTTEGGADVFVARLDAATGAWLWVRQAGYGNKNGTTATGNDIGRAIAPDGQGGVLVAGNFNGPGMQVGTTSLTKASAGSATDLFVARLNAAGTWLWARNTGQGDVTDLASDTQGNAYLCGEFANTLSFATTQLTKNRGSYLAKLSSTGTWQWAQALPGTQGYGSYGSYGGTYCGALATDEQNHLYVAGRFDGNRAIFGSTMLLNTSGVYYSEAPGSIQRGDVFVARMNTADGTWQWAAQAGGLDEEYLSDMVVRDSRVYVSGSFGIPRIYSPSGQPAPTNSSFGGSVLVSAGEIDGVVAALDTNGRWQWAVRAGGTGRDQCSALALDALNRVYVAGSFASTTAQFGSTSLASTADLTPFLARLAAAEPLPAVLPAPRLSFAVYPNPARAAVTVTGLPGGQRIEVLDALGRVVVEAQMPAHGPLTLACAGLAPGLYMMRAAGHSQRLVLH